MVQAGYISTVVKIRKCILYVPVVHCPWPSRAFTEPPGPGEHFNLGTRCEHVIHTFAVSHMSTLSHMC